MHSERGPLFESFKRQPHYRDAIRSLLYFTLGNVRYSCIEYILARTEVALYLSIQVCSIAFIIATIFFLRLHKTSNETDYQNVRSSAGSIAAAHWETRIEYKKSKSPGPHRRR